MKHIKIHYAWVMCGVCMLLIFCNMGLCNNGFSVWLHAAEETEGFTGAQGSSIMTVRCVFSLLCMAVVTKYFAHLGVRFGAFIGTALSALAYFVYSLGGSIWVYYLGGALAGVGYGFGTTIAISLLINRWFIRCRGLAMGISTAGTGICTIVLPPVMTRLIRVYGLHAAFRAISAFVLASSLLILLLARDRPELMGLHAFGEEAGAGETKPTRRSVGSRDLKGAEWGFAALALLFVGAVSTAGTGHFAIVLTSSGYSAELAAAVLSAWGVVLIGSKFLYGAACDRFGCKAATAAFYSVYILGCLTTLLFDGERRLWPYVFALLYGIGIPPATVGFPLWAADLSRPEHYACTMQVFQVSYVLGGVIFTSVPGVLYDRLGSYQSAYLMFAAFTVAATAIVLSLYRREGKS